MPNLIMRFDMRNPDFGASTQALYDAALDMAVWAEEQGFDILQISEHHCSSDGYLPSPIVLASAMMARTKRIRLRFSLIILPLNNPLKLAEDLAVLDVISNGRIEVVFGGGYVPEEFEMFGVDPKQRGALMEEGISTITEAWRGKPFQYQGRKALVLPRPVQQPRPPLWLGGSSKVAARRAARLADNFYTPDESLYKVFREEAIKLGRDPGPWSDIGTGFLAVADNPDSEWKRMAPFILHECNSYGRWQQKAGSDGQYIEIDDVRALKNTDLYPILRPEEAIAYARERGEQGNVCLHPLISGFPPKYAWQQLHYFAETVLPYI
ncbi:LLM class flavin-dependent oxidoreductase [Parahaliea sp. F7430]|uniref:LLM class flavin-dependent oxidoreductase n=1 Tax=Sediminihaliea albiluteola TaxID=2758564 RepID=A0A7W2TW63_9GAMM|nr:LLM class flavin-dependent oxidoreductase [Sediminihaliea albiluteola]MBA6413067.1 LLM class flavin-dependent oxidoreductase [Sediminihaliea albiluteola]